VPILGAGACAYLSRNRKESPKMKTASLADNLATIGWSNIHLAQRLGCDEKLIRKWHAKPDRAPAAVVLWLAQLAAAHVALPVPTDWRQS
jgi:hypothetical protein